VAKRPAKPKLGRLEKIDPTDYWQTQADFQQWLVEEETLELLGEAVGLQFALAADHPAVGYSLLSDTETTATTLVAAHLAPPIAADLGLLLTWAAATDVAAVLWVAPEFSAEVMLTLDWLNQTSEIAFVGLTVELWRIGKAAMAANFIPCCGAVVEEEDGEDGGAGEDTDEPAPSGPPEPEPLTEIQQENLDFWSGLCDRMDRQGSLVKPGSPVTTATMGFAIARAGFRLNAIVDRDHQSLYTELLLSGIDAQPHFYLLAAEREAIADAIDLPLIWDASEEHTGVIACTLTGADLTDRDRWPAYHAWFCDCLERFYEVFFDRIKRLDAAAYQPPPRRAKPLIDALVLPASQHH
jgi:hypothetical protein